MDPKEESNFLDNYQKNYFQEGTNDVFKVADIKRKCTAQTYIASHTLLNNTASCNLLKENLSSYTELVNDLNGINNYAENIKVLTTQTVEKDCSKWQSNLDTLNIDDLLKPLTCKKNCTAITDMKDQLNMLFEKQEEPVKLNNPNQIPNSFMFNKKPENNFPANNPYQPQTTNNFAKCNVVQPSNNFNKYSASKPNYENRSTLNRNYCDIRNYTNTTTSKSYSQEEEEKSNKFGMFKTAKDELHEQSVKKYAQKGNYNMNTGVKKSLGARRGVNSKFRSPMLVDDEGGSAAISRKNTNNNSQQEEEELDERLKNIDPKMVELIRSEIMDSGTRVNWDDIAGLEFAKNAIQEAVVWPLLRPDIFTGLRRPPKGILLFGPPGTGKTLIGKCIASQSQSTFFSISASSLTSKWIGDGEKMVRAMFAVARVHQPAVIFIDEIDSLLSQRSDTEHESSRRIKTEFLVQLDGAATAEDERILLVGATNRPQELDEAARRRFVKRLYIPLPEKAARLEIVKRLMSSERNNLTEEDMNEIANLSDGYSGADMKNLCSEASLGPIRSIDFSRIQNIQPDEVGPVTMIDFKNALHRVRASVSPSDLEQYVVWDKTYGSGGW